MPRRLLVPVLLLALTPALVPADAQRDDAFAGIPGVSFTYYDVGGGDAAAIRAAIDAVRPTDPGDGTRVDALTHWTIHWRWHGDGHGGCDLAGATLRFAAVVTLPRLIGGADAEAQADWNRYMAALRTHEAGHVRYAWQHLGEVADAVHGATCATAGAAGRAAIATIARHDRTYDRETRHGFTQGAYFP